jgi:hypothetical protein
MRETMPSKYELLTSFYLALWKLIDLQFPAHHWLELTPESEDKLFEEIKSHPILSQNELEEASQIGRDMDIALGMVHQFHEKPDFDLQPRLINFRRYLQEQAFDNSAFLSPPAENYFGR